MARKRTTYHHGNLRPALVEAALALIDERGVDDLSVREVARRAGVSSAAPFRHFEDKAALLAAVAEDAQRRFSDHVEAARRRAKGDAVARFQAVGVAFVEFAVAHPAHFRVMNLPALREVGSETLTRLRRQTRDLLRTLVVDAQEAGRLAPGRPAPLMITAYALVYGLSRMYVDGLADDLGLEPEKSRQTARMATQWLGRGLETRGATQPTRSERRKSRAGETAHRRRRRRAGSPG